MENRKNKVLITASMIIIVRFVAHIPVPWVDTSLLKYSYKYSFTEFSNIFSGGAIEKFTIGAVGISAYISASILYQILSFLIPSLHRMGQSPSGQMIIKKGILITGIILSPVYSFATVYFINKQYHILIDDSTNIYIAVALLQTLGAIIYVLAGNIIEEKGIGEGISTIIFVNILSSLPSTISSFNYEIESGTMDNTSLYITLFVCLFVVLVTFFTGRIEYRFRLSVPYDKSESDRGAYLPFKLAFAGVMPMIYAQYVISIMRIIGTWFENDIVRQLRYIAEAPVSCVLIYIFLTMAFTLLIYKATFDYAHISRTLNIGNCIINGLMPGIETKKYIKSKCIYLLRWQLVIYIFIAFIPEILSKAYETHIGISVSAAILVEISVQLSIYICNEYRLFRLSHIQHIMFEREKVTF